MDGKTKAAGFLAVGFLAVLPALEKAMEGDDFQAVATFVMWILLGLVVVKVLAILAGVH
ncbi:MAG: hypothetical protein Q7R39_18000 [Dehalococcoidia bacterium]|nr:hypothetical protein [Dehalococcoidia bacterium]